MQDVRPIKPHNLAERAARPVEKLPEPPPETDQPESGFVRAGLQKTVLRRLRNGQIPIEDELDLHGLTVPEAERELRAFLRYAQAPSRQRAIRVIHGKGLGSKQQIPVLKAKVVGCLVQCEAVLAFCVPGPESGGTGAVHVLLKRR
jgi:DNA-nicking Smr family endonuclease